VKAYFSVPVAFASWPWLVISAKKNYRVGFAEFKHINLNL